MKTSGSLVNGAGVSGKAHRAKGRPLRSGYTTGACAAAAAKGAVRLLAGCSGGKIKNPERVSIPLPGGKRAHFKLQKCSAGGGGVAAASVIKDAGDDPDVTNGAEIEASARFVEGADGQVIIKGGEGVGVVTRPGLPVPPGRPAINPVPEMMIREAVGEALKKAGCKNKKGKTDAALEITISVPEGRRLARRTLNARLGIVGGISILGTTGIVKPLSGEAWKASITASMKVARAMGTDTVVLSAGRTSERAHMKQAKVKLPEAAYVLMGDYVGFSLGEAARLGFSGIHLCAQWAKMLKIAMGAPDTHVRAGAMDPGRAADFLREVCGVRLPSRPYNTAREIFDHVPKAGRKRVCAAAAAWAGGLSGLPVRAFLVSYEGDIIEQKRHG